MNLVRQLREAKGMTQQQLADAAELSRVTVQRAERARTRIAPETAMALASVLETDAQSIRLGIGLQARLSHVAAICQNRDATAAELNPLPEYMRKKFLDF
ncbi:MAG TPA: helix-turn-helix transcriptional regulator, partial [Polyangiaceae bacterium]|nr:helix-turn-helix transcriptional regulator [Polyangiaceae bacterium]